MHLLKKHIGAITGILILLVAFVLGMKQLHEPDLFWMLRTGEWMAENKTIPTTDVFSYTHKGTEWISVKWLFELIIYGIARLGGQEFILILQSIVNVLMVIFLGKTAKELYRLISGNMPSNNMSGFYYLLALVFLFIMDFRMVGRPEMVSHLFTLIFLYLFVKYRNTPGKFIFWLIPLQALWVNLHEAYAIGMVLLLTFFFGLLADRFLSGEKPDKNDRQFLLATGLAFLAVAINPRGFYLFYHPWFLFKVVGSNHYTTELNSLFYKPWYYFSYKEPYFAIGIFGLTLAGLLSAAFSTSGLKRFFTGKIGIGYTLSLFSFFYLGLTGHRNVVFPVLVALPLLMALIDWLVESKFPGKKLKTLSYGLAFLTAILFYIGIVTNVHYKYFQPQDRYGLHTRNVSNPDGAARFANNNGLNDQRCFSDYLTSSYFLWALRPGFETFIDLRDLDIFEREFFDEFARITYFTNLFDRSDSTWNYRYAMIYRPQFTNLHRYLYHDSNWVQVYADPVAAVYVKNSNDNREIIENTASGRRSEEGIFYAAPNIPSSGISYALSKLFWPLYEENTDILEYDSNLIAAQYFRSVYDYDRADVRAQMALEGDFTYDAWFELGTIYLEIALFKKDPAARAQYISDASEYFSKGIKLDRNRFECYRGMGMAALYSGNYGQAVKSLKKAIKNNPDDAQSHVALAECYARLLQQNPGLSGKYIPLYFEHLENAYQIDPDNQQVILKLASGYCQQNKCDKAKKYLKAFRPEPGMNKQDLDYIGRCKKRCL